MLAGPDHDTLGPEIDGAAARFRRRALLGVVIAGVIVFVGAHLLRARGPDPAVGAPAGGSTSARPTLVLFTADWCPPCRTLKSQVLANATVKDRLATSLHFTKVDLTDRRNRVASETAARHGVDAIPTLILFDRRGREIDRLRGATDARSFLDWLAHNGV